MLISAFPKRKSTWLARMSCTTREINDNPERDQSHGHINRVLSSAIKRWHSARYSAQGNVKSDPESWHNIRAVHPSRGALLSQSDSGREIATMPRTLTLTAAINSGTALQGKRGDLTAETPADPAVTVVTTVPYSSKGNERKRMQNLFQEEATPCRIWTFQGSTGYVIFFFSVSVFVSTNGNIIRAWLFCQLS